MRTLRLLSILAISTVALIVQQASALDLSAQCSLRRIRSTGSTAIVAEEYQSTFTVKHYPYLTSQGEIEAVSFTSKARGRGTFKNLSVDAKGTFFANSGATIPEALVLSMRGSIYYNGRRYDIKKALRAILLTDSLPAGVRLSYSSRENIIRCDVRVSN